ncbi:hypothetical protein ABBQ38_015443 [Trebouxia sp. C0009 RCD-2024]
MQAIGNIGTLQPSLLASARLRVSSWLGLILAGVWAGPRGKVRSLEEAGLVGGPIYPAFPSLLPLSITHGKAAACPESGHSAAAASDRNPLAG